jgi:hypothetical protein
MSTAVALAVHIFGAVIWVGGMFAIYVCLRPALGTLDPPQRLRLMRVTFQKFFPCWRSAAAVAARRERCLPRPSAPITAEPTATIALPRMTSRREIVLGCSDMAHGE